MSLRSELIANGFVLRHGSREADILRIAAMFGTPVAEPRDGVVVKPLRPVEMGAAPQNTLSSRYGTGCFPLHTEAAYWREPPDFLIFYCVGHGSGRQDTLLLDGDPLARGPGSEALRTDPWIISAGMRPFLCTVLRQGPTDRLSIRFDRDCMRPATMTSVAKSIVESFVESAKPYSHRWQSGDLLILDNSRMLHGRGAATGVAEGRTLLKVMVKRCEGMR